MADLPVFQMGRRRKAGFVLDITVVVCPGYRVMQGLIVRSGGRRQVKRTLRGVGRVGTWKEEGNPTMCGEGGAVERIQLVLDTAHCYNMRQRVSEMENAKR